LKLLLPASIKIIFPAWETFVFGTDWGLTLAANRRISTKVRAEWAFLILKFMAQPWF